MNWPYDDLIFYVDPVQALGAALFALALVVLLSTEWLSVRIVYRKEERDAAQNRDREGR